MKGTFVALAFAAATQAFKIEKDAEIIAGLFTGITQEEGLTNLDGCIYGGDRFTMQIVHGVEMIIEFDLRSVISGTRSISRAVAGLPDMLSDCTHSTKDVEHLLSWATIFLRHDALV